MPPKKKKPDVVYMIHQITKTYGIPPEDSKRNFFDTNEYWRWVYGGPQALKKAMEAVDEDAANKMKTDPCDEINNRGNDNPVTERERDHWSCDFWTEVYGCNKSKHASYWVYHGGRFYKADTEYEIIPLPVQ